jgi:DNA-binding response OmpR family regulator
MSPDSRVKILVIEDDPTDMELVRWALTDAGHTVDAATTGEEGGLLARVSHYDAIVLDLMLPDTSGIEIVRRLRLERHAVPVLMLTSKTATEMRVAGLDAGADDYLTKPFDVEELRARLRALTRRGGALRPQQLTLGPLMLDQTAQEIRIGGKPLDVTPKEHALLEYFMLHPGELVSRADLLENAWDMNFDPQSNVIDAHVARLRAKLRAHAEAPQLETARGRGFRLILSPPPRPAVE